ncbi:MAG TPA: selenocysteine-specific translation elongation factor [Pyrinomonadaceae bacterium]|nr:selenocysteine-specific translation elongation factor [Pyrinomonadaceae bacterium]
MPSIIVGTAGHIDHGKTTLVRALTGVDADRLPEEKRRGITIDLGFADLDLGDVRIGFVDVPGHERFVKNMLAGAHGIDVMALVVASDEGVMPQTREHFDIARLLEVTTGLVVITKVDSVDAELLELVRAEVEELVAGSFLETSPIVAVSARTGAGLDELRERLRAVGRKVPERSARTITRLPIDRAFTMRGFGAVVTGTLVAGEIAEGDEMELLPGDHSVRVRGVQVHGASVGRARAGQRTAVNLGGVEAAIIERGMVLAPAGSLQTTQIVDAQIEVLPSAPRPLRSRQRVRVHLGTAEILARVVVLEAAGEIAAGERGLAQFRFESPIVTLPDERFIVRSYSPSHTIAGGRVLDAHAAKHRGRERGEARARLATLVGADDAGRVAVYVEMSGERGLRRVELAARTGWRTDVLDAALVEGAKRGEVIDAGGVLIGRAAFESLMKRAVVEVEAHHRREPLARGLARETLREKVFARAAPEIFRHALEQAETSGMLVAERDIVRAASHSSELIGADAQLRDELEKVYRNAALEAPTVDEALTRAGGPSANRERARKILQTLIDAGTLRRVTNDLLFHRDALDHITKSLREYAAEHEPERLIDVAAFKDLSGVSRKYAIPLLEYLDRERVTRRAGDRRIIL